MIWILRSLPLLFSIVSGPVTSIGGSPLICVIGGATERERSLEAKTGGKCKEPSAKSKATAKIVKTLAGFAFCF